MINNEIKEILDDLDYAKNKERGTITLNQKDINLLIDYITNLQQENKDNEQLIETQLRGLEKQKQIIEKSVEILKRYTDNESNYYVPVFELIDILNGRSDE